MARIRLGRLAASPLFVSAVATAVSGYVLVAIPAPVVAAPPVVVAPRPVVVPRPVYAYGYGSYRP
jgi:hypothetical protein